MKIPDIYIVVEIPHTNSPRKAHIIQLPGKDETDRIIHEFYCPAYNEPGHYRQGMSIDAFNGHHKRQGASATDKKYHRDGCSWGPESLYIIKSLKEWEKEIQSNLSSIEEHLPNWPDERKFPRTKHPSFKDFTKFIGFDTTSRRYRTPDGKPINYSIVQPEKAQPKKAPEMGPEI